MVYLRKSYWLATFLCIVFASCASAKVTRDFSGGAKQSVRWELITVQSDYIGKSNFLAISHLDGEQLSVPLIFGLDVILLSPGEHQLRLVLGEFQSYEELGQVEEGYDSWVAELGGIELKEPPLKAKGRNYLVASYDKIYTSNTESPEYMQRWIVNYPRTIDASKNWSIEPLDPQIPEEVREDE